MNHYPDQVQERWSPIPGYEGLYEVSDQGNVRTLRPGRYRYGSYIGRQIKHGYRIVMLTDKDGRKVQRPVHQLVLEAFVGPREPGQITRHLNDVKTDNRLENLAWGTHLENSEDSIANGRMSYQRRSEGWNR